MRIAILSDIHGNATALHAVLNDAKQFNVDKYILLGDYFDAGPEPVETYNILRELNSIAVKGNHDNDLILYSNGHHPEWNNCCLYDSLLWTYKKLSKDMVYYLSSLPEQASVFLNENKQAHLAHYLDNITEGIMSEADPGRLNKVLSSINESVLMCGHTHNPFNIKIKEKYYINPGSVGQPKKRFAEYFVLVVDKEDLKTIQRPVPYDIEKVKIAFIKSGYLDEGGICAKMNILSLETGKSYFTPFKNYAREYARNVGFNGKDIPKEILIEASESWDWIV